MEARKKWEAIAAANDTCKNIIVPQSKPKGRKVSIRTRVHGWQTQPGRRPSLKSPKRTSPSLLSLEKKHFIHSPFGVQLKKVDGPDNCDSRPSISPKPKVADNKNHKQISSFGYKTSNVQGTNKANTSDNSDVNDFKQEHAKFVISNFLQGVKEESEPSVKLQSTDKPNTSSVGRQHDTNVTHVSSAPDISKVKGIFDRNKNEIMTAVPTGPKISAKPILPNKPNIRGFTDKISSETQNNKPKPRPMPRVVPVSTQLSTQLSTSAPTTGNKYMKESVSSRPRSPRVTGVLLPISRAQNDDTSSEEGEDDDFYDDVIPKGEVVMTKYNRINSYEREKKTSDSDSDYENADGIESDEEWIDICDTQSEKMTILPVNRARATLSRHSTKEHIRRRGTLRKTKDKEFRSTPELHEKPLVPQEIVYTEFSGRENIKHESSWESDSSGYEEVLEQLEENTSEDPPMTAPDKPLPPSPNLTTRVQNKIQKNFKKIKNTKLFSSKNVLEIGKKQTYIQTSSQPGTPVTSRQVLAKVVSPPIPTRSERPPVKIHDADKVPPRPPRHNTDITRSKCKSVDVDNLLLSPTASQLNQSKSEGDLTTLSDRPPEPLPRSAITFQPGLLRYAIPENKANQPVMGGWWLGEEEENGSYEDMVSGSPRSPCPYLPMDGSPQMCKKNTKSAIRPESSNYITPEALDSCPDNKKTPIPFDGLMVPTSIQKADSYGQENYIDFEDGLNEDPVVLLKRSNRYTSQFVDTEPLYQVYSKELVYRASIEDSDEEDDDCLYEDTVAYYASGSSSKDDTDSNLDSPVSSDSSRPPVFSNSSCSAATRSLWCEMPEVINSGILERMSSQQRKLQEAMFEVITSEVSYLKSLDVLLNVFMMSPEFSADHTDRCVLMRRDRHVLFSNVIAVRDVSEKFLIDLENTWQRSFILTNICDIISKHSQENFGVYVTYCANQVYQDRKVKELKKNQDFNEALRRLESSPECQSLNMESFLLLPMQRITRLPLLIDAICHRMKPGSPEHDSATRACGILKKTVRESNNAAKRMERTEEMFNIERKLDFKVKTIPLISASRHLVKQGELTRLVQDPSKFPFGKGKNKLSKQLLHLYLFSDMILVTKKKSEGRYSVLDYCPRNAVLVECMPADDKRMPDTTPSGNKHFLLMALLDNHENKHMEFVLACDSETDRTRWFDALSPIKSNVDSEEEKIYESWDCPQVQAIHRYEAQEPDEISLEPCDVVNVLKKLNDGWYEGERLRDGEQGWFPALYTVEIISSHIRAKNLRQRYRLLAASKLFIDEVKTPKK